MTFSQQAVHVFRHDVRRFFPALVAVVAYMGVVVSGVIPSDAVRPVRMAMPIGLLPLILGTLAAVVVQRDGPADEDAFWTTRPLRPGAVLFGKVAFIGIFFVGLPVLVQALWFAELGAGEPVGRLSGDAALHLGGTVAVAAAAGAVTRSLRGVLACALAAWLGASILTSLGPASAPDTIGNWITYRYLERWLWVVLGMGLLGHQYLTRRTRRTVGLGLVLVTVLVPAIRRAPIDLTVDESAPVTALEHREWDGVGSVRIQLQTLRRDEYRQPGRPSTEPGIAATLGFEGGSGALMRITEIQTRVTGGDVDLAFTPPPVDRFQPMGSRFVRPALDGIQNAGGWTPASPSVRAWVAVGDDQRIEELTSTNHLALTVSFDVIEPVVLGRMGSAPGATLNTPYGTLVVRYSEKSSRKLRAEVGHRWSVSHMLRRDRSDPFHERISFAAYSPRYNEVIMDRGGSGGARTYSLTGGATLVEPSRWAEFEAVYAEGRDGLRLPADWFDDVEILVLDARYAGSFTRTIERDVEWPTGRTEVRVDRRPSR